MTGTFRGRWLALCMACLPMPALAAYYQVDPAPDLTTYPWITPGGSTQALADDATSGNIAMGFTFNFGGTDYTQLRIGSNGWLFFGGVATTATNTALPSNVDTAVMPFWTDLNPASVAARIRYETVGVSPNRRFVVSYVGIPHYCNGGGACVANQTTGITWTFQVQFHETSNDIIFWYDTMGTQGGAFTVGSYNDAGSTVGVEVENGDFTQFSFNTGSVASGSALRFYYNPFAPNILAEYHMDETTWGSVMDSSGNGNDATASGSSAPDDYPVTVPPDGAINTNPGTCGAGSIAGAAGAQQVSTPLDPNADIGNTGTIAFWYSSNTAWNDGNDRMLLDASNEFGNGNADKHFYLAKNNNGALRFAIEDSADTNSTATTANQALVANTWHHIAVTWNLASDRVRVYLDGALAATATTNVNGTLGDTTTLYIGDQRITTLGGDAGDYTANSANGYVDEVKILGRALFASEVAALMTETHPCGATLDHYLIGHDGSMVTCLSEDITFTAHSSGHATANPTALTDLGISTSTGRGTWTTLVSGTGTLSDPTPGNADNGDANYQFPGGESSVTLRLRYTAPVTDPEAVNFNLLDENGYSEATGTAAGDSDDADLSVASAGFEFYNSNDANTTIPTQIAGKRSDQGFGAKNLALRAVRVSDSDPGVCTTVFPDTTNVAVDLGAECSNPATCAGQQVSVTNNGNTTAIATNDDSGSPGYSNGVTLLFGANSTAELHISYPDAGQVQLHARYDLGNPAGTYMVGSSNDFVVRPFGFRVAATGNPAAADENGTVFTAADEDFTVTVTAVGWEAGDDGNNDGIPDGHALADVDPANNANLVTGNATLPNFGQESGGGEDVALSAALDQPAGGADPGLAGGTTITTFTAGAGDTATARYAEVGIIELSAAISDGDYLGTGAGVTELARSKSGRVGRFRPYDFNVTGNSPTFAPGCNADTTDFTYLEQPFTYGTAPQVTITARSKLGTTTTNYDGVWWKLADFSATHAHDGDPLPAGTTLDTALAGHTGVDCSGGTCNGVFTSTFSGPFTYTRTVIPVAPFGAAMDITLGSITDTDSVSFAGNPFKFENIVFTGAANEQRWGRLTIGNSVGDPALALDVPLTAEYFDGSTFVQNADDDCSAFTLADDVTLVNEVSGSQDGDQPMAIGGGTTSVTSGDGLLVNGQDLMTFGAPGSGNTGLVDIILDLDTATGADLPWLYFDWDGDAMFETTTTGRVSFGIQSQPQNLIYSREPW